MIDVDLGSGAGVGAAVAAEWQKAIELGITDGSNPQGYATREQVAAMLVRALKLAECRGDAHVY